MNLGTVSPVHRTKHRIPWFGSSQAAPTPPKASKPTHKRSPSVQFRTGYQYTLRILAFLLIAFTLVLNDGGFILGLAKREAQQCATTHSVNLQMRQAELMAFNAWTIPTPLPQYRSEGEPSSSVQGKYTIMLNTFKRHDLLETAIRTYENCPNIDAIRVIWSEQIPPPDPARNASLFSKVKEIRYDAMPTTSFNNRFRSVPGLRTEAVLALDDDVYMPCSDLDRGYAIWQEHPRQLAGYHPRAHVSRMDADTGQCSYSYTRKLATIWLHQTYSIVLTKAAFLHRDYLEMYTYHMPSVIRSEVDRRRNCEDIAMQFLVSYVSHDAPHVVPSLWITDVGQGNLALGQVAGVSASANHIESRSECLNVFTKIYGGKLPLVSRTIAETPSAWKLRLASLIFWR